MFWDFAFKYNSHKNLRWLVVGNNCTKPEKSKRAEPTPSDIFYEIKENAM